MGGGRFEARRSRRCTVERVHTCDVSGLTLLAVVVTSACFRSTTTITVKQDGSGTIDQEIGASAGAMALLRNFSSGDQADKKPSADVQLFGPEQAQAAAAAMGVRFVSGEPVKTAEVEGYRAHFAFDDVTKVKFSVNEDSARPGAGAAQKVEDPPFAFGFAKSDGISVLTINIPEPKPGETGMLPKMPGSSGSAQDNAQAMSMLMPMLRGLYVDVSLDRRRASHQDQRAVRRRIAGHAAAVRFRQGQRRRMARCRSCSRSPTRGC